MRKAIAFVLIGGAFAFGQVGVAHAGTDATLTATLTGGAIGSRSITSVAPIALISSAGSGTVDGSMATLVTETAVTGDATGWSITAALTNLSDGSHTLSKALVDVKNRAVVQVAGGGTSTATTGTEDLSATRTLFSNSGQSATSVYTGTNASTADLSLHVPNGTATGVYTGTMTVTLIQ
jgi:hypothetical protein